MIIESLVTDRTLADVTAVNSLAEAIKNGMATEAQVQEYLNATHKGAYNYTDFNRVEEAVMYVSERLKAFGYLSVLPDTRVWNVNDKPNQRDFERYFSNVDALRSAVAVWGNTPEVPNSSEGFDVNKANALEKILVDVDRILNNMANTWFYSGDLYLSEV